jgi:cytochrome P450 family 6
MVSNENFEHVVNIFNLICFLTETLRKHPPIGILTRNSSKDYKIPGTDQVIPQGKTIMIPVYGIHHDANIYPDPEKFDPERFSPEEVQKRHPCAFLPFGEGPKNCIGLRFAYLQSKLGLVKVLMNYKWTLDAKTQLPLRQDPRSGTANILGDIWLKAEKLDTAESIVE